MPKRETDWWVCKTVGGRESWHCSVCGKRRAQILSLRRSTLVFRCDALRKDNLTVCSLRKFLLTQVKEYYAKASGQLMAVELGPETTLFTPVGELSQELDLVAVACVFRVDLSNGRLGFVSTRT